MGSEMCIRDSIKKFREDRRERFLSAEEFARLGNALAKAESGEMAYMRPGRSSPFYLPKQAVAALKLLILTGARRGEIVKNDMADSSGFSGNL